MLKQCNYNFLVKHLEHELNSCENSEVLTGTRSVAAGLVDLVSTPVHVGTGALTRALQTTQQHKESNEPHTVKKTTLSKIGLII